jgi:hypothetical protein
MEAPNPSLARGGELPCSFTQCPNCGAEFEDVRIISIPQFAANLMVSAGTVRNWIREGKLKARLWNRFGHLHRVILASEGRRFLMSHFIDPQVPDGSYTMRLWYKAKAAGEKGFQTRKRNRQARKGAKEAERASPTGPAPERAA